MLAGVPRGTRCSCHQGSCRWAVRAGPGGELEQHSGEAPSSGMAGRRCSDEAVELGFSSTPIEQPPMRPSLWTTPSWSNFPPKKHQNSRIKISQRLRIHCSFVAGLKFLQKLGKNWNLWIQLQEQHREKEWMKSNQIVKRMRMKTGNQCTRARERERKSSFLDSSRAFGDGGRWTAEI